MPRADDRGQARSVSAPSPTENRRKKLAARAGGSLRTLTAGGVMINAAFNVALQGLALARGFVVAAFIAPSEYGIWALIVVGYYDARRAQAGRHRRQVHPAGRSGRGARLSEGVHPRGDPDGRVLGPARWRRLPVIALIYRAPEIIAPGLVTLAAHARDRAADPDLGVPARHGLQAPAHARVGRSDRRRPRDDRARDRGRRLLVVRDRERCRRMGGRGRHRPALAISAAPALRPRHGSPVRALLDADPDVAISAR